MGKHGSWHRRQNAALGGDRACQGRLKADRALWAECFSRRKPWSPVPALCNLGVVVHTALIPARGKKKQKDHEFTIILSYGGGQPGSIGPCSPFCCCHTHRLRV